MNTVYFVCSFNVTSTIFHLFLTEHEKIALWQGTTYGLCHAKTCLRVYADNNGPVQAASAQSDQDHHCPLSTEYERKTSARMMLCACAELSMRILRMF